MLIVFDLDGTLVDTLPAIAHAMNAVLREEGLPEWPQDAYRRFAGDGAEMLVRRATRHELDNDPPRIARLLAMFKERDEKTDEEYSRPYAGVREMLAALRDRGDALAILSNKEQAEAEKLVAREFGADAFARLSAVDGRTPLKPDPTGLLVIMKDLGYAHNETAYVGDTDTDMRTGRNAGVLTLGCAWGFRDEHELRATGADEVARRPADLVPLLRPRR